MIRLIWDKRFIRHFIIYFYTCCICSFLYGSEVDFVLDSSNQSYKDSFSNQFAVDYLTTYLNKYKETMASMLGRWADTHAMVSAVQPAYGRKVEKFNAGISIAGGTTPERGDFKTGMGTVDDGAQEASGFGSVLYVDLPSATVYKWLPYSFLEDVDVTIKFLPLTYIGFEDVKIHMINAGIILRRNLSEQYIGSFGMNYSLFKGRENDVGLISGDLQETVVVDDAVNGTVTIDDPSDPNIYGKVHYPFMEARSLNIDAEIKQLWDYNVLQVILGVGFTLNFINKFSIQAFSDVNARAADPSSGISEAHDGKLMFEGTEQGSVFMPRLIVGVHICAGPVIIPIQASFEQTGNRTGIVTTGLMLAF